MARKRKELPLLEKVTITDVAAEGKAIAKVNDLMVPGNIEEKEDYSQRISGYMEKAIELKRSDLANYVAHRRVIIDLLEKAIQVTKSGKFNREDVIHKLIIPMICESTELRSEDTNLWLINESLAFHDFLASGTYCRDANR